jgi:N-acetylmuramidase
MAVCVSEPVEGTRMPSVVHPTEFYSQNLELQQSCAAATPQLEINPTWSASQRAIAATFNRLGDLFRRLVNLVNVPIAAALAVWFVESSGLPLTPGRAILRFEVGKFLAAWGRANPAAFNAHFQCGGHNGKAGEPWQNHAFRLTPTQTFMPVHADCASEYAALQLAQQLSSPEVALRCASIGGCQILLSNFAMLGYVSASAMFEAFQRSENAHVLGFFDFCARQAGGLIGYLQQRDFASFALHYNGPGQVQLYATRLRSAAADAETVLAAR